MLTTLPFVFLLLSIAILPNVLSIWWNNYYPHVSIFLAIIIRGYYLIDKRFSVVLSSGEDYIMFITLLLALYIISGGDPNRYKRIGNPCPECCFIVYRSGDFKHCRDNRSFYASYTPVYQNK